jgi:hypothetical protein
MADIGVNGACYHMAEACSSWCGQGIMSDLSNSDIVTYN